LKLLSLSHLLFLHQRRGEIEKLRNVFEFFLPLLRGTSGGGLRRGNSIIS
jgi:hypothetical protein